VKLIRDASVLISALEQGQLVADLSTEVRNTLQTLKEMSGPKRKVKGSVTLKLSFSVEDNVTTVNADLTAKVPAKPRSSDLYWVTDQGELSTQHPRQIDMGFDGPRAIRSTAVAE
jgi:hypothetical protein